MPKIGIHGTSLLGIEIDRVKKMKFKGICKTKRKKMKEVLEPYIDRIIENPSILEELK